MWPPPPCHPLLTYKHRPAACCLTLPATPSSHTGMVLQHVDSPLPSHTQTWACSMLPHPPCHPLLTYEHGPCSKLTLSTPFSPAACWLPSPTQAKVTHTACFPFTTWPTLCFACLYRCTKKTIYCCLHKTAEPPRHSSTNEYNCT